MKNTHEEAEAYSTKDVYLTATLLACDCDIQSMKKDGKQFTFFITSENGNVQEFVDKFWAGELPIDAKKLFNSYREMRARMYN